MRDPELSDECFNRDRVLVRRPLVDFEDPIRIDGLLERVPGGFCLSNTSAASISFAISPTEFSQRCNAVTVRAENRSEGTIFAGIRLVHARSADNPDQLNLSFSGGRAVLPRDKPVTLSFASGSFGFSGYPEGWSDVSALELTFTREKGSLETFPIAVLISGIVGEQRFVPRGPRLTEDGLVAVCLRDPREIIAGSKRAHSGKERPADGIDAALLSVMLEYVAIPPPHPYPRETSGEVLQGNIMGQRLTFPISWHTNPHGSHEWTHFLNRHHFIRELADAGRGGDDLAGAGLDSLLASWIEAHPVPVDDNGGAGPSWETLTAAWRLWEWLHASDVILRSPLVRLETESMILRSIREHASHLRDHTGHPNNWIIVESAALALAGLCCPWFSDAHAWVETGLERLEREVRRQFFADGAHFELSPLYHAICLQMLLEVKQAAEICGAPLSDWFDTPLERCFSYLAALVRPNFTWPALNDSGSCDGDYSVLMGLAASVFQRGDFRWIATHGKDGSPGRGGTKAFPDAGIAVQRSHWGTDAQYLLFRNGPPGFSHAHGDTLSIEVAVNGQPRLVDPGIVTYGEDELTAYYRSAAAHTTILVNGRGADAARLSVSDRIRPAGETFAWGMNGNVEIASGMCSGPWEACDAGVTLSRTVLFVRGEYWIVVDRAWGEGETELTVCWQFAPGRVNVDLKTYSADFLDPRGAGLRVMPLSGGVGPYVEKAVGTMKPAFGWVAVAGRDIPAPHCRYSFSGTLPRELVWVLIPARNRKVGNVKAEVTSDPGHQLVVKMSFPDGTADRIAVRTVERRVVLPDDIEITSLSD